MIVFISAEHDLSAENFEQYRREIDAYGTASVEVPLAFVIGDLSGGELMIQRYLHSKGIREVTVYHTGTEPQNNVGNWPTAGGFVDNRVRDHAMTYASDKDIAIVTDVSKPCYLAMSRNCCVQRNIQRRQYREQVYRPTEGMRDFRINYLNALILKNMQEIDKLRLELEALGKNDPVP